MEDVKPLSKEEMKNIVESEICPRGGPEPSKCEVCCWATRRHYKTNVWTCQIMNEETKKKRGMNE